MRRLCFECGNWYQECTCTEEKMEELIKRVPEAEAWRDPVYTSFLERKVEELEKRIKKLEEWQVKVAGEW